MRKIITLLVLITGINSKGFTQNTGLKPDIFEIPDAGIYYRYNIDIGKGNTLQIELNDLDDIGRFKNIDSVLDIFLRDISSLKDSLSDPTEIKRIDYLTDIAGRKKIRISSFRPQGSSFVIRQGEIAALKTSQDTVNIIGILIGETSHSLLKSPTPYRYYRLRFLLNDYSDLSTYREKNLSDKITSLVPSRKMKWRRDKNGDWHILNGDQAVSSKSYAGNVSGKSDQIGTVFGASISNYKNYFVPSFSAGLEFSFNNGVKTKEIGILWEPAFLFAKNSAGKMQTFRNDFFTLSYRQILPPDNVPHYMLTFNPSFSLSWLKKNRGDFFEKNTFRLGLGKIYMPKTAISVEPQIYFNDFFKHATPGVKINIGF